MDEKQYYVGLDIGTTNVVMVVGSRVAGSQTIKIESLSSEPSKKSIVKGLVTNRSVFRNSVNAVKKELEKSLDVKIEQAYFGVGNADVRGVVVEDMIAVRNKETGVITKEDIMLLEQRIHKVELRELRETIINIEPICYYINGTKRVLDPVGMQGSYVVGHYLITLGIKDAIAALKALKNAVGLEAQQIFANATIGYKLLVSEQEAQKGVVLVDIGGGITDVTIIREGRIQAFKSFGLGSENIDSDIKTILPPNGNAVLIKHKYGCAMAMDVPENQVLQMGGRDVLLRNVAAVIEARVMDIIDLVVGFVRESGFEELIECGYVLTGGATELKSISDLFGRETLRPCRCADHLYNVEMPSDEEVVTYGQQMAVAVMLAGASYAPSNVFKGALIGTDLHSESEQGAADKGVEEETAQDPQGGVKPTAEDGGQAVGGGENQPTESNDTPTEINKQSRFRKLFKPAKSILNNLLGGGSTNSGVGE